VVRGNTIVGSLTFRTQQPCYYAELRPHIGQRTHAATLNTYGDIWANWSFTCREKGTGGGLERFHSDEEDIKGLYVADRANSS